MNWALIQHVHFEGPGLILPAAATAGLRLDIRRMWAGDQLPTADEISGLVVMGGPMGATDTDAHAYLVGEAELILACAQRGLPVLGVCLGCQLVARALGADVRMGPVEEVGLGTVTLTDEGHADPVLGPAGSPAPVFHWHRDTFDLPQGAVRLASSYRYENQAFRVGSHVYGFQFHVELDPALAASIQPHLPPGVVLDEPHRRRAEATGVGVLARFFTGATNASARARDVGAPGYSPPRAG